MLNSSQELINFLPSASGSSVGAVEMFFGCSVSFFLIQIFVSIWNISVPRVKLCSDVWLNLMIYGKITQLNFVWVKSTWPFVRMNHWNLSECKKKYEYVFHGYDYCPLQLRCLLKLESAMASVQRSASILFWPSCTACVMHSVYTSAHHLTTIFWTATIAVQTHWTNRILLRYFYKWNFESNHEMFCINKKKSFWNLTKTELVI